MSKIPSDPWSHLCWPETKIKFNIEELLHIYNTVFSKYERVSQAWKNSPPDQGYKGIGFQGFNDSDIKNAPLYGNLKKNPATNKPELLPPEILEQHLQDQMKLNVRHKELCVGEFARILDFLEEEGWHTHRARIMELTPYTRRNWHVDSWPGLLGNNVRFHVPLLTNDEVYLRWYEEGKLYNYHVNADGTPIWFNSDVNHQYVNEGPTLRAHIIIDVIKK